MGYHSHRICWEVGAALDSMHEVQSKTPQGKDTSGPSLNIFIKLTSVIPLILAPTLVGVSGAI